MSPRVGILSLLFFFLLAILLLAACDTNHPVHPEILIHDFSTEKNIRFVAVGRQGYPTPVSKTIAGSIGRVAREKRIQFVVLAGDNFYPKGVESTSDPQWQDKFERLYDSASLQATPFYAVAGNHDHRGNTDAQLAYARDKLGSRRWQMDELYYARDFGKVGDRVLLRMVFLDTVTLKEEPEPQVEFLQQTMKAPGDPVWRVIVGHYPARSLARLKFSRSRILENLRPVLKKSGVDLYLSANDRFQQVLTYPDEPLHVSTNGGGTKREEGIVARNTATEFVADQKGFSVITVKAKQITVEMNNQDGETAYEKIILRD